MMIIHAYVKVKPQYRESFTAEAKKVIAGTQAEEGNISYRLYEDTEQPNTYVVVELWQDQQAIALHQQSAHFIAFAEAIKDYLLEPLKVEVFEASKK